MPQFALKKWIQFKRTKGWMFKRFTYIKEDVKTDMMIEPHK